jgi:predicted MFS family arabinose efflux permease
VSSGPPRVLSAQLLLLLLAGALGMAALSLALPILPLTVAATTHDRATAGLVTGIVAAFTIALELLSPGLLHRFRVRPLLVAAMLLQLVAMAGFAGLRTLPAMLVCGAVTGAGFGLVVTVTVAAVGALVPPGRSGEAIGYFGLCASAPSILGPPLALLLLDARGAGAVFQAGALTCAAAALTAALPRVALPRQGASAAGGGGVLAAMGSHGVLRVWLAFACTTLTYGAAVSFTPLLLGTSGPGSAPVFLLVFGVTRMLGRVAAGRAVDRVGERRLALPSLAAGALALVLLQLHAAPATVVSGAVSGAAFGVVQTATFVGMLRGAGRGRSAGVSGIWSMAVDAGIGGGALGMGPIGAAIGLTRAFWLLPALFALAFVLRLPATAQTSSSAMPP